MSLKEHLFVSSIILLRRGLCKVTPAMPHGVYAQTQPYVALSHQPSGAGRGAAIKDACLESGQTSSYGSVNLGSSLRTVRAGLSPKHSSAKSI